MVKPQKAGEKYVHNIQLSGKKHNKLGNPALTVNTYGIALNEN